MSFPFRLSHALGDTPPGLETEQILRELANSKTERQGEHANALLRVLAASDKANAGIPAAP